MANKLFDNGRNEFALGNIKWKSTDGDIIKVFFVDYNVYTPNLINNKFLSDIPTNARIGNNNSTSRTDAPQLILKDPNAGICDAEDIQFTGISQGKNLSGIIIFKDTGNDETSILIVNLDNGVGLPTVSNGNNILIEWDNGINKIFKL